MTSPSPPPWRKRHSTSPPEAAREVFQKIAALWDCPTQIKGESCA